MSVEETALTALAYWGEGEGAPRLINHRENAVFEVCLKGGPRAALRLHRPGYHPAAEILSELQWTAALGEGGFAVPRPVPRPDGSLLATLPSGQHATLIEWVDGAPVGEGGIPFEEPVSDQCVLFEQIGRLLAELHETTDGLTLPEGFTRPRWDCDGFLGETPLWGRFWENPALKSDERELVEAASTRAHKTLSSQNHADFGLIHADALRENVFRTNSGLVLIDYDDSGFGYRLYDIAVAASQSLESAQYDDHLAGLVKGYDSLRPLGDEARALLPLFAMLRSFASMGWAVPRLPADDPKLAAYTARAVRMAHRYMDRG